MVVGHLHSMRNPPHLLTREDVRCYLEFLVDAGAIYTKVAVIRQQQIQSPLDKVTGQTQPCPSPQQIGQPRSPAPTPQPVGRMQIRVRRASLLRTSRTPSGLPGW